MRRTKRFAAQASLGAAALFAATGAVADTPSHITQLDVFQTNLNYVWILTAAGMVFLMQAGFMCLEAGIAAAKH